MIYWYDTTFWINGKPTHYQCINGIYFINGVLAQSEVKK